MLQNMMKLGQQQPQQKPQRNGSARTTGEGSASTETMLAADVCLVASGVGKGCTEDNLKKFLVGKGITPVEVKLMTKPDVVNEVRTLTFTVAVKPADYDAALKPEVWPYRVAVRHYRAPRRERPEGSWQEQSGRSGGQINAEGGEIRAGEEVVDNKQVEVVNKQMEVDNKQVEVDIMVDIKNKQVGSTFHLDIQNVLVLISKR